MLIQELAKAKIVEEIINNVAQPRDQQLGFLDDLANDIYIILLEKKDQVEQMPENQQRYYIARMITNQLRSKTSRYHYNYRRYCINANPISSNIRDEYTEH